MMIELKRMKKFRLSLTLVVLFFFLLLSACTGAPSSTWPGVTATQDTAYVANGNGVFAVNLNNGTLLWRFPDKAVTGKSFYAAPVVTDDGQILVGDYSNTLYSVDLKGKQNWIFDKAKGGYNASPLTTKDGIYAPNTDDTLYALTLQGALRWSFATKHSLWAQPATDGALLYLPSLDHNLYALQVSDGKQKWATDLGAAINSSPTLGTDGILYVGTLGKEVLAVKTSNGQILWRVSTDDGVWGKLVLQNGNLVFGDTSGKIYSISASNGKILWTVPKQGGLITGGAAVLPDGFVLTTETSNVIHVDPTGKILWNQTISGKLYATPIYVSDHLLVASMEGDSLLVSLDQSGKQLWAFVVPK
jgi:outer membrane protein assembly factor BamB